MDISIAVKSIRGDYRPKNEDTCLVTTNQEQYPLAVLCDGMGGHAHGKKASSFAAKHFAKLYSKTLFKSLSSKQISKWMVCAIEQIKNQMYVLAQQKPEYRDMGTTFTAVAFIKAKAYIVHIGDSRIAFYDGQSFTQISKDHNLMNKMLQENEQTELINRDLYQHQTNYTFWKSLTSSLGPYKKVKIQLEVQPLKPGYYLLSSDGFHDYVSKEAIVKIFKSNHLHSLKKIVNQFILTARHELSTDNISTILVRIK